jgi:tripartite-type tricarboxylate transporter receptor subunit TctC
MMPTIRMIVAVTTLVTAIAPATAQNWPTRPVTIVYPFGAGSAGDVLGRIFASRLSDLLGQPVIFENVGGAGGMTGASRVAKAAPDGYQVLLGTTSTLAVNQTFYRNPLYNAVTDFAPVALIAESPIVLVARKDLPANNLQEFIAHAKANQAKMQYGSAGVGSSVHLACAGLNAAIGVSITHIPYRGGGSAMQDLIAGRIDYQCPAAEVAIPHIQGNSVKAIAVLTKNPYRDSQPWWPDELSARKGAPNIVIIILDDVGFADLGCYGSEIATPSMDRLARGGVRYSNFHVTSMCSPTRACLFTGRNAHAVGMGIIAEWSSGYPGYRGQVTAQAATIPEVLRDYAYGTYAVGKWHLTNIAHYGAAGPQDNWP